jgi:hypothetical protein
MQMPCNTTAGAKKSFLNNVLATAKLGKAAKPLLQLLRIIAR